MKKSTGVIIAAVIACCAAAFGGYKYYSNQQEQMEQLLNHDTIYNSISVNGVDVSNLRKEEAAKLLEEKLNSEFADMKLYAEKSPYIWDFKFSDFNAGYDVDAAVEAAYSYGREGSLKERYNIVKALENEPLDIISDFYYDEDKVDAAVAGIEKIVNSEVKDSTLTRKDGEFIITDDAVGYKLNNEKTAELFKAALESKEEATFDIVGQETLPAVTRERNEKSTSLIGTYFTTYTSGNWGRNENLRVGCMNIDGTIVEPGEVFSMNVELGPQTYEAGYQNAAVIVNGKLEDGLAGGVCQVTSTLYNAVILAELEIVERSNHSLTVGYVPLGQDAAIAGDYKDLKFRNNTDYPVYIEAYVTGDKVICNVFGNEIHEEGRKVVFENVMLEKIEKPEEIVTEDPNLPFGTREVTSTGYIGYKYQTFKNVYQNGKFISREYFSRSNYKATPDEVTIGTGDSMYIPETPTIPNVPVEEPEEETVIEVPEEPKEPEEPSEITPPADFEETGSIFG